MRPDALLDLSGYGEYGSKARVFLAPPLAPGEAVDARRRILLVSADAGEGHFRAVEGDDDGYWDGAPAFDPRSVFAELAGVRTALRERYKLAGSHAIYTYMFSTPADRPVGRFHLDRVPGAMLLEVNPAEPYATALRITLAAGMVQELWDVVRAAPAPKSEAFTFGFARAYARELLRRFGTLSASDVAADVTTMTTTLVDPAAYLPAERRASQAIASASISLVCSKPKVGFFRSSIRSSPTRTPEKPPSKSESSSRGSRRRSAQSSPRTKNRSGPYFIRRATCASRASRRRV
ncbi:hypothetical protein BH09MYX1_BH09MYX1_24530 [soil metagenome]